MTKRHDREYFYKYVTAEVAKSILDDLQIKCSSPLLFNDPFDSHIAMPHDIKDDRVLAETMMKISNNYNLEPRFEDVDIEHISDLVSRDASFVSDAKDAVERVYESLNQIEAGFRVFCVSEKRDDLLMWSHYAHAHKGAVIKFRCLPENETALCGAQRVNYSEHKPIISLKEFIVPHSGRTGKMSAKVMEICLTKSVVWEYEKEWRMILKKQGLGASDMMGILEDELEEIYLGCRMPCVDKKELLDIIKAKRKHMRVFQSEKDHKDFKLNFRELSY